MQPNTQQTFFKVIFVFKYYNKILYKTFLSTKTHTNYARDSKCFRSNFARPIGCRSCFGCQIYIKCNFSETFVYFYIGSDSRELFFIQNGIRQEKFQKTKEELDVNLNLFYAEARNKDGGMYSRNTLLGFRNGLERYLKNPPYNNLVPLLVLRFLTSKTSQHTMSDSTSQPCSRAAKSGKFTSLPRAIKRSDVHFQFK